MIFVVVIDG